MLNIFTVPASESYTGLFLLFVVCGGRGIVFLFLVLCFDCTAQHVESYFLDQV